MATFAQIDANRANARHSTGPRSADGKARSAANSFRHGFRSQTVLLPGDDPDEYDGLLDELTEHFSPADLTELRSVREMADAERRLRHIRQYQEERLSSAIATLGPTHPDPSPIAIQALAFETLQRETPGFALLLRYETKFERQYERASRNLASYREEQGCTRCRHVEMDIEAALAAPIPFPFAPPMPQPEQEMPDEPKSPPQPPVDQIDNAAARVAAKSSSCQNEPRKSLKTNEPATAVPEQPDQPPPPPSAAAPKTPDEPNSPPPRRKTSRNAPCPCRSGLKYKRCCGRGTPTAPGSTPDDRGHQS